jgi:hypothetical protein
MTRMTVLEALETYENGNITDFKDWLKKAKRHEIVHVTYLWLQRGNSMLKLKAYTLGEKERLKDVI